MCRYLGLEKISIFHKTHLHYTQILQRKVMMTRTLAVFFALMFCVSCGKSEENSKEITKEELTGPSRFKTKIKMISFYTDEKEKILKAAELIQQVIASEEFKEEILDHEFNGKKAFADNRGLSNRQIYQRIMNASEKLTPGKDHEMDLTLVAYLDEDAVTVGYTYPNTHKIWMNRKYFGRQNAAEVTTNMVHEWLHKLGFDHDSSPTPERRFSVPYSVGYIVRRLAQEL